ncbi:hypothetical protein PEC18_38065 [Paucibacter sp. O1-1]|nr:hypothetical protein [Paucibacter sp. O1-1]MDA3831432.1 hypothetical protein [Paucibacter sp. O1-1]
MIGSLLPINQLVSYWSVAVYFIKPSYEQINQSIARQINILFVDGVDVREHLTMVDALNKVRDDGMTVYNQKQILQEAGLGQATYYSFLSEQMSVYLGGEAEVRFSQGENLNVWIKPPQAPTLWIKVPLTGINESDLSPLTLYLLVIGALSVAGGWLFARRQNRPLKRLQKPPLQYLRATFRRHCR